MEARILLFPAPEDDVPAPSLLEAPGAVALEPADLLTLLASERAVLRIEAFCILKGKGPRSPSG